jgi:hypothetical protein
MTGRTRAEHARRLARAMEIKMDKMTAFQKVRQVRQACTLRNPDNSFSNVMALMKLTRA